MATGGEGGLSTIRPGGCNIEWVEQLISKSHWNESLLRELFSENEVQLIMSIPLSVQRSSDIYYWYKKTQWDLLCQVRLRPC